jgi:hypothetical protein
MVLRPFAQSTHCSETATRTVPASRDDMAKFEISNENEDLDHDAARHGRKR